MCQMFDQSPFLVFNKVIRADVDALVLKFPKLKISRTNVIFATTPALRCFTEEVLLEAWGTVQLRPFNPEAMMARCSTTAATTASSAKKIGRWHSPVFVCFSLLVVVAAHVVEGECSILSLRFISLHGNAW
jgi:hypothetical protein